MNAPQRLLPMLNWLEAIGSISQAFSFVLLGYTFGAAAIFCIVLALLCVGIVAAIVLFGMRGDNPTEW